MNEKAPLCRVKFTRSIKDDMVQMTVWVAKEVEEFFKTKAAGLKIDVNAVGRGWKSEEGLKAYDVYQYSNVQSSVYELTSLGKDLKAQKDFRDGLVNLSWLRLAGISRPEGITFKIKGIYSPSKIIEMSEVLRDAFKDFYEDHLMDVSVEQIIYTESKERLG